MDGDKICLPIPEVLLRAAAGNLVRSNNWQDWKPRKAVFLPQFQMEAEILDEEISVEELLKIFA